MLIPRITKADNSIVKQMYKDGYILRSVTPDYMYWDKNETIQYEEENQDKQAMYEKMRELKADPERYKELEQEAFNLLTPTQQRSEAMKFHRDTKIRQMIIELL